MVDVVANFFLTRDNAVDAKSVAKDIPEVNPKANRYAFFSTQ